MSLLELDNTKKEWVDKNDMIKLNAGNNKSEKYKIEAIWDRMVYTRESVGHLSGLYYLIF